MISSSVTVAARPAGVEILPREPRLERRRMRRPARDLRLSLERDFTSSLGISKSGVSGGVGELGSSRSLPKEERWLLKERRWLMLLVWWTDGGLEGDLGPEDDKVGVGRGSPLEEVTDRRRSLMKSLTTLKDERREALPLLRS